MKYALGDSVGELLSLVVTALASGAFTVAGLLIERAGVHDVLAGQGMFGLWEVGMGTIPLIVGVYLLGYQRLWPRLRSSTGA